MTIDLTAEQISTFERYGYVIVRAGFEADECDQFVHYMKDLQARRSTVEGYTPRDDDDWDRLIVRNCHNPVSLAWLIEPRLRQPLTRLLGAEPDGVQSMFFFRGSEQRRHQDAFHLPGCMSAWVALQDVGAYNGSLHVQVGSHRCAQLHKGELTIATDSEWYGGNAEDAFDTIFERNGLPEIAVEADKGDVVFFDGRLIHRGGPIEQPDSFRYSWAGHYIPRAYDPWPYEGPPRLRVSFDGVCRFTSTESAA